MTRQVIASAAAFVALAIPGPARAQPAQGQAPATCASPGAGQLPSVERHDDGRVTFRICAPEATSVALVSPDHPALRSVPPGQEGMVMTKDELGRWSGTTTEPVPPGTYRYRFLVNGVRTPDPMGTLYSEERMATNSLLVIPGAGGGVQDYDPTVPHGAITEIEYWSQSLGVLRRAHVYTPPGYMKNTEAYPVLYLVHGAGDNDDAWSTIGRANYILDNLIARGEARPMIVVMPFGHTPDRPGATGGILNNADFGNDFLNDLIPYVEANFRTLPGPENRAMAGLSMGGAHTIRNGLTHPELFHYLGIFSMGLAENEVAAYEAEHADALRRAAQELRLLYFAMGETDFLYNRVAPTRALFEKYGIDHIYNESPGGHTWINWREYLTDFAPRLFK